MSICATVGRPIETEIDVCIHDGFVVFDGLHCSQAFLFHVLKALEPDWSKRGQTGSQMNLNTDLIRATHVAVPQTTGEQEAIAEALSDADALIESLEQLIAKKRLIKQGVMQELLTGKRRLAGFAGQWRYRTLSKIGHFLKGKGVSKSEANSGPLPCVRYGEIYTSHHDHIRQFQSGISAQIAEGATRLVKGDLLFAGSGETKAEIGKCVAFIDDIEAYAGGDIVVLRPLHENSAFLGYCLNSAQVVSQKASRGQGDAVVHISAGALAEVEVHLPCVAEQSAIASVLMDIDSELAGLEARAEKARAIKQGMMQQLLTGRIRLL
jgi:type I restriction enzyme S subunit